MLTNWQETILNYTFTIKYRPGVINILSDALSRLYPLELRKTPTKQDHQTIISYMHVLQDANTSRKELEQSERSKGYHPMKAISAQLPGEHVAIDLAGPLPMTKNKNVSLLVVVDVCTRSVFLRALQNKEGITIVTALWYLFCTIGFPKIIQSDNGKKFVNNIMKIMVAKMKIDHPSSYHTLSSLWQWYCRKPCQNLSTNDQKTSRSTK